MNIENSDTMRAISRGDLHDLWQRAKAGEPLEGEEAILARMMQEHTEYVDVWEQLDELGRDELVVSGVSPILHVNMHSVIENQLEQNTPPEVRKALDDQLGVFDSAGVHWAIWTWKDIASMGSYNLDPESEYVKLFQPIMKVKKEAADWEGEMPKGYVAHSLKKYADAIDTCLTGSDLKVRIDRRWFAQYTLFGYLAQFLQVPYANLFKEKSEKDLDNMLSAFELKKCIENKIITKVLKEHF